MTTSTDNETLGARRATVDTPPTMIRMRRPWRQRLRMPLMVAGPLLVLIVALWWYVMSGRYESTDDAYVQAARVQISNEVSGRVVAMEVHDNQLVKKDQVLFRLDQRPYQIAVEQARANLATARLQIEALKATYKQKISAVKANEATLAYNQREFERQQRLLSTGYASQSQFDQANHAYLMSQQQLAGAQNDLANVLASLGGNPDIPVAQHPTVQAAQAALDKALLNLSWTDIRAPDDGIVTKVDQLQVGDYVQGVDTGAAPTALFSLVSTRRVWVEANFKETELTHMHPGQSATIVVDTYPDRVFDAQVQSLSPGTGLTFSLLPAENATGNWVKVVQRLPVRFTLTDPGPQTPLHAGLSATVEVDTGYHNSWRTRFENLFAWLTGPPAHGETHK